MKKTRLKKPRLSKKTIETLFHEGKAYSRKYEYEVTREWSDELNTYEEKLTRWDENNNYNEWEVPANEGIWAFKK